MSTIVEPQLEFETISVEEGKLLLDREARELLGISGEEFIRRYIASDLTELVERDPSAVSYVSLTLPFAGVPLDAWKTARRGS